MPRIMRQHAGDEWRPLLAWPDDCGVQWGGHGVVLSEEGSYGTAFFEAFPAGGVAGFIRGEGATVEAAEADAFATFERQRECFGAGGHLWTRARRVGGHQARLRKGRKVPKVSVYGNGGCFCLRCGAFQTAMKPTHDLDAWRQPLSYGELEVVMSGMLRPDPRVEDRDGSHGRWQARTRLRALVAGIEVPDHTLPEHARVPGANPFREDAYMRACREAVVRFYVANRDRPADGAGESLMAGLFDSLTRSRLEREAEAFLAREAAGS